MGSGFTGFDGIIDVENEMGFGEGEDWEEKEEKEEEEKEEEENDEKNETSSQRMEREQDIPPAKQAMDEKPFSEEEKENSTVAFEEVSKESALDTAVHALKKPAQSSSSTLNRIRFAANLDKVQEESIKKQSRIQGILERRPLRGSKELGSHASLIAAKKKDVKEIERALDMYRKESQAHKSTRERLGKTEETMIQLRSLVASVHSFLKNEKDSIDPQSRLQRAVDELERNGKQNGNNFIPIVKSKKLSDVSHGQIETSRLNRLKAWCSVIESEKQGLKEKLSILMHVVKEREESDAIHVEKERSLEEKISELEKINSDHLEANTQTLCRLTDEFNEKERNWGNRLQAKESDLSSLLVAQNNASALLIKLREQIRKACRRESDAHTDEEQEGGDIENKNIEIIAMGLGNEIEKVFQEIQIREDSLNMQRRKAKKKKEQLRQEQKELEEKMSKTVSSMELMTKELREKDVQINKERAEFQALVAEKAEIAEVLQQKLDEKDRNLEESLKQLQDEIRLLDKELDKESREKQKAMETHLESKQRVMKLLHKKERKWVKEVEILKAKIQELTANLAARDDKIQLLEETLKNKEAQYENERKRWMKAVKEIKQKATKTILSLVQGEDVRLLRQVNEWKQSRSIQDSSSSSSSKLVGTWKLNEETQTPVIENKSHMESTSTTIRLFSFDELENKKPHLLVQSARKQNTQKGGFPADHSDRDWNRRDIETERPQHRNENIQMNEFGKKKLIEWPPDHRHDCARQTKELPTNQGFCYTSLDFHRDLEFSHWDETGKENIKLECENKMGNKIKVASKRW